MDTKTLIKTRNIVRIVTAVVVLLFVVSLIMKESLKNKRSAAVNEAGKICLVIDN